MLCRSWDWPISLVAANPLGKHPGKNYESDARINLRIFNQQVWRASGAWQRPIEAQETTASALIF